MASKLAQTFGLRSKKNLVAHKITTIFWKKLLKGVLFCDVKRMNHKLMLPKCQKCVKGQPNSAYAKVAKCKSKFTE